VPQKKGLPRLVTRFILSFRKQENAKCLCIPENLTPACIKQKVKFAEVEVGMAVPGRYVGLVGSFHGCGI